MLTAIVMMFLFDMALLLYAMAFQINVNLVKQIQIKIFN